MHSRWTIGRQAGLRRDTDFMHRQDGRFGENRGARTGTIRVCPASGIVRSPSAIARPIGAGRGEPATRKDILTVY